MSDVVTLTLRDALEHRLDVDGVTPDRFAVLTEREIADLPVWLGARAARLGDFFAVRGGCSPRVRIEGELARVNGLAAGAAGGETIIDGDAGHRVGAGMSGGVVTVRGRAGDEAGVGMAGGILRIGGGAGDRLGAAPPGASKGMTGGEIIVEGSAGSGAGARLRRGLIVVGGDVGEHAGNAMIAGSVIVLGATGRHPGRGSKRGSIVGIGPITPPVTYRYACTFEPPHVRLTMIYLRRRHGLAIDERVIGGMYRRYCGDMGDPGKGEILALDGA